MKRIVLSSAAEITMLFGEDFSLGGNQVLPVFEGECLNKWPKRLLKNSAQYYSHFHQMNWIFYQINADY